MAFGNFSELDSLNKTLKSALSLLVCLTTLTLLFSGCGDPTLHPLTGKVTLDGKPYERLIVYFDPIGDQINEFNFGVGETDAEGNLGLRSSAGSGLAAGNYRVSFTCLVQEKTGQAVGLSDEKDESYAAVVPKELVPEPYNDRGRSPVEFSIRRNDNVFTFDIPLKQ